MRVLITGLTGQDGQYLARHLIAYTDDEIWGMVRDLDAPKVQEIVRQGSRLNLIQGDLRDQLRLIDVMAQVEPHVIYNLAALSSPAMGWQNPELMSDVTGLGTLRLLSAAKMATGSNVRVMQACSLARHGIYGAAKTYARAVATDFREQGMHVYNVVLGGHHSPLRGPSFFSQKVAMAAAREETVGLGDLSRSQDWGYAPEFVEQFPKILELGPDDYVLSTGDPHTAAEYVQAAYEVRDLDWRDYVVYDKRLTQPTDVSSLSHPPDERLNWTPEHSFKDLVEIMVSAVMS